MNRELAIQIGGKFIQRRDVKAVQVPRIGDQVGAYMPDRELRNTGQHAPLGFNLEHIEAHLAGERTYGHYLLDENDLARCFVLDIDLQKSGFYCPMPSWEEGMTDEVFDIATTPIPLPDLRSAWLDRAHPARNWLKYQMGMLARRFTSIITEQLGIGSAAAYSGNKGIHVYGFTGPIAASEVRAACLYVLEVMDEWELIKGQHFFGHRVSDPALGYQNFSIETFPKQDSLDGKDLGNLVRLPLGRNLKSPDPTFFIDLKTPPAVLAPHSDPVALLTSGNPYL